MQSDIQIQNLRPILSLLLSNGLLGSGGNVRAKISTYCYCWVRKRWNFWRNMLLWNSKCYKSIRRNYTLRRNEQTPVKMYLYSRIYVVSSFLRKKLTYRFRENITICGALIVAPYPIDTGWSPYGVKGAKSPRSIFSIAASTRSSVNIPFPDK